MSTDGVTQRRVLEELQDLEQVQALQAFLVPLLEAY